MMAVVGCFSLESGLSAMRLLMNYYMKHLRRSIRSFACGWCEVVKLLFNNLISKVKIA